MPSENQYVLAFQNDDSALLEAFYKKNWPAVLRYILKNSGNEQDAKDIYQSSFLSLYENIQKGKYKPSESAMLSTYFIQICKYKWLDFIKSAHHRRTTSINSEEKIINMPSGNDTNPELSTNVTWAVEKLGERCQQILKMFYWQKYSMEEIALEFEFTRESAKNAKYRCLKRLKSILQRPENDK